jgi:GTP cyclohydrolase I
MAEQIANVIDEVLRPQGIAVVIKATHHCVATRGIHNQAPISSPTGCSAASARTRSRGRNFSG